MHHLKFPNSDLRVSRLCIGGEQLGGFDWGDYDVSKAVAAAAEALEKGINFFDTADCYGMGGSERRIGKIIHGRRQNCVVSTKFGVRINPQAEKRVTYDNSPKYMNDALRESLKRLDTDYIDLYQIHHRDEAVPLEEVCGALERQVEAGLIRYYGISNSPVTALDPESFPNLLTYSYEYSLANRKHEETIDQHRQAGYSLLSFGTLGQGVLTGKYTKDSTFSSTDRRRHEKYSNFYGERFDHNLQIVDCMRNIAANHSGATIAQVALRWVLQKQPTGAVIVGIKNSKQLRDNLGVFEFALSKSEVELLDNVSKTPVTQ